VRNTFPELRLLPREGWMEEPVKRQIPEPAEPALFTT